ncbi:MAG: nucleotidyltransferase [Vicinamibacteraceae bacterium]|nr:nucleotidyltransferase [Vicinamibacteraceae bacterium]
MRSPFGELLADLAEALDEAGVEWYLFGAQAAALYGVARLTADVDVTVRLQASQPTEMLAGVLERHGFVRRFSDPQFMERTRVAPFVHSATTLPVDIVLAGPGLEEQFLRRAAMHEIEGVRIPLASAEDLVVMKVLAGRPKDLDDVFAIATNRAGSLDVGYIQGTLRELEQALGQSDLGDAFASILGRTRKGPAHP